MNGKIHNDVWQNVAPMHMFIQQHTFCSQYFLKVGKWQKEEDDGNGMKMDGSARL